MMPINELHALTAVEIPDGLPTEFRIFKLGPNPSTKGTFVYDEASALSVMARYAERGVEMHLDYEHDLVNPAPGPKPAAGWFVPEARADGLYATNVRYTKKAASFLAEKEYRYFSPLFFDDEHGRVVELWNVALTNDPALMHLPALVAASAIARKDPTMKSILTALGLKPEATEADAINALSVRDNVAKEILTLTGKFSPAEALGVINAWKAGAEQVVALSQEVASLKGDAEKRERDALILSLKADKKLTPAMEGWASKQSIEALKAFGEVAPTIAALSAAPAKEPQATSTKAWKDMTPNEKHDLYVSNPELYAALKVAK